MDKIVPAFEISLMDHTLRDACSNIVEYGIDSILNDGIFKSIPIASVLIGTAKTAQNIHDRNLLRQTLKFINTFNDGSVDKDKLEKYRNKINTDSKKAEEELGRVIILLNNNVDLKKSELMGKLFKSYVNEVINWNDFCEYTDIINRLFISDLSLLYRIKRNEVNDTTQCKEYQAERLISLGLLNSAMKAISIISNMNSKTDKYLSMNSLGNKFCELTMY